MSFYGQLVEKRIVATTLPEEERFLLRELEEMWVALLKQICSAQEKKQELRLLERAREGRSATWKGV